jgi:spore maturation protein CgeB
LEYFVPNQDAGIYTSLEEAADLAAYYLANEEQRQNVARSGMEKVRAAFRMEDRLKQIMDLVMQGRLA